MVVAGDPVQGGRSARPALAASRLRDGACRRERATAVIAVCVAVLSLWIHPGPAAAQDLPPIDGAVRARVADSLASQCVGKYVDPDLAKKIDAALRSFVKAKETQAITDPRQYSMELTKVLQDVAHDKHLRVRFDPKMAEVLVKPDTARDLSPMREEARRRNFAFRKVEILDGNIGYLRLDNFERPEWAGETAVAAMNWLGNADALIVDLRYNGGGWPEMIQLISSYLFGYEPVHLNSLYFRPENKTNQYWTLPWVPGRRSPDRPVFVLISSRTFSGAEEFAYNLKELKRAVLIGETTGGGANPGDFVALTDGFIAFVPTGKAINPISNTNWEGVGVAPDIQVPADQALDVAQEKALEALVSKTGDGARKSELAWMLESLRLQRESYTADPADLAASAGTYGIRTVRLEGGKLYYQRQGQPAVELRPLARDLFGFGDATDVRIRFVRGEDGRIVRLEVLSPAGVDLTQERTE